MPAAVETSSRSHKSSQGRPLSRHKRSGYEPSDTETDGQESPWRASLLISKRSKTPDPARIINPFGSRSKTPDPTRTIGLVYQRQNSKEDNYTIENKGSRRSPGLRRRSKYPYKVTEYQHDIQPEVLQHRNTSPIKVSAHHGKHVSPYRSSREETDLATNEPEQSLWKQSQRTPSEHQLSEDTGAYSHLQEGSGIRERSRKGSQEVLQGHDRSNHIQPRSVSAPKPREMRMARQVGSGAAASHATHSSSPFARRLINGECGGTNITNHTPEDINETIANMKLSKSPTANDLLMQSTESVSLGDIFISRDCTAPQKEPVGGGSKYVEKVKTIPDNNNVGSQFSRGREGFIQKPPQVSFSTIHSQRNTNFTSASAQLSNGTSYTFSSKFSDSSGKLSGSFKLINAITQRGQSETWLSCMRGRGSCARSKSPDNRGVDEASFIERALVVEELTPFWADKHSPRLLSEFVCHRQQARHLKQLISHNNCPHIIFKGPSGAGKKSLSRALLHEIFGDSLKTSDDLRYFQVQEAPPVQIVVPLNLSPHHVELNLKSGSKNARYALMALVKEMMGDSVLAPEVSEVCPKPDYKVLILYGVDKAADSVQHLIKWIMDRYTGQCKIILCCEDDSNILDIVKSRCKLIPVDAPSTNEVMEVLILIAKAENFELSASFAARIATKSKQNLRDAIMALEACKAHNYPFVDEQPILLGWEQIAADVAAEILADPSAKRLFFVRGKLQKLLVEFVHPKLILRKLVEQFLKRAEAGLKRELYFWHAYYEKRLPTGTSAQLKLEEFIAKFMSIYRKSSRSSRSQIPRPRQIV